MIDMLKLFITPTSIVFEDLTEDLYIELVEKYDLNFVENDVFKIEDEPANLYQLLYKLSFDYDIDLN